ncbi:hypothetical protein D3C78_948810 [compost metagenome]
MNKSKLHSFAKAILNFYWSTSTCMILIACSLNESITEFDAAIDSLQLLTIRPLVACVSRLSIKGNLILSIRYERSISIFGNGDGPVVIRSPWCPQITILFNWRIRICTQCRFYNNSIQIWRVPVAV